MSVPFYAKAYIVIKIRVLHLVRYMTNTVVTLANTLVIVRKNVQSQMYTSVGYVAKATLLNIAYHLFTNIHKCGLCSEGHPTKYCISFIHKCTQMWVM